MIEMAFEPPTVAPCAGAWIETDLVFDSPLKLVFAPRVGAWIETIRSNERLDLPGVAPHVGAWIETKQMARAQSYNIVAPRAGAWIETHANIKTLYRLKEAPRISFPNPLRICEICHAVITKGSSERSAVSMCFVSPGNVSWSESMFLEDDSKSWDSLFIGELDQPDDSTKGRWVRFTRADMYSSLPVFIRPIKERRKYSQGNTKEEMGY